MTRLFHVSHEANIQLFVPRPPERSDVEQRPVVWAINEECLPNYLLPRQCPRVAFQVKSGTPQDDMKRFFPDARHSHAVCIEEDWLARLLETRLTVYGFDPAGFVLQDEEAGYYVSHREEVPISKQEIQPFAALQERGIDLRLVPRLWPLAEQVQQSSLRWSLIRMRNAQP